MFGYPEIQQMSLKAIQKINESNINCSVLTKGILPIELSEQSPNNVYGITLVSLSENFRKKYEPGSAPITDRVAALKALHDAGCRTWVSIEPYPTPNIVEQDLLEILHTISFVDKIIFGRMHYNKEVTAYKLRNQFFNQCANVVIEFCTQHKIDYHIKDGTITP